MFKKLRNKFVLINLLTTSVVLGIAFSSIYLVAATTAEKRPPLPQDDQTYSKDISEIVNDRVRYERGESLNSLLASLLITGAVVEVFVLFISLYLANLAIKPVKEAYLAQKEFIANASHEIKTPLAIIQANLEAADIKDNPWIDNVAAEVADLGALNSQLLTLARLEARIPEEDVTSFDLQLFVKKLLDPLKPQVKQHDLRLRLHAKDLRHSEVTLNRPALKQILGILFDNAIKYARRNIDIVLTDRYIKVKNDGATISEEGLKHIFDRFYQTDKTKNGVGLGLAIAAELAELNHWKLTAKSDDKTTSFYLYFK